MRNGLLHVMMLHMYTCGLAKPLKCTCNLSITGLLSGSKDQIKSKYLVDTGIFTKENVLFDSKTVNVTHTRSGPDVACILPVLLLVRNTTLCHSNSVHQLAVSIRIRCRFSRGPTVRHRRDSWQSTPLCCKGLVPFSSLRLRGSSEVTI